MKLTLWAMLDASVRQKPTNAPPNDKAQARLPFFNQAQFFNGCNPQIYGSKNNGHGDTYQHILQVEQILGQRNTHDKIPWFAIK